LQDDEKMLPRFFILFWQVMGEGRGFLASDGRRTRFFGSVMPDAIVNVNGMYWR
jgi:hypothetical protein